MLHTFYFLATSHPILLRAPTLVAGFFLALTLAVAACGGGAFSAHIRRADFGAGRTHRRPRHGPAARVAHRPPLRGSFP